MDENENEDVTELVDVSFRVGYGILKEGDQLGTAVTLVCRLVGEDGVPHDFGRAYNVPDARRIAASLIECAKLAELHARVAAGDEEARAEAEELADRRDENERGQQWFT
jgi:hypothetical protein